MKEIRLNAFEMNCVGHQSPGLWAHPRDRSLSYTDLGYWTDLAKTLERVSDGFSPTSRPLSHGDLGSVGDLQASDIFRPEPDASHKGVLY